VIDIILATAFFGFGYVCFRLGSKYRTLAEMVKAIKAKLAE